MSRRASIVGTLVFLLFGPLVWGLQMAGAYIAHASLCAAGDRLPLSPNALPWLLAVLSLAAAGAALVALLLPDRLGRWLRAPQTGEEAGFAKGVMRLLALLSLFGIAYLGLSMILLPFCDQLR